MNQAATTATTPTPNPVQGLDLAHLRNLAGDDDIDLFGKKESPFKPDVQYPVQITEQSIVQATKGLSMLKLTLRQIVSGVSGPKPVQDSILITIPIFNQRAVDTYGSDKLDTIRRLNAVTLNDLIRATYPESFQGNVTDAGKIVMGAARAILKGELVLKTKRCYYARRTGKDASRTFDAFSAKPFDGVSMVQ